MSYASSMITIGARLHGAVGHVITRTGDVSACGRMVIPGKGVERRMCLSCVRINADAQRIDDRTRKMEREARILSAPAPVVSEPTYVSWEYRLNGYELEVTLAKIAKINERCEKRGIPGGLSVEYTEIIVKEKNDLDIEIEKVFYDVHIEGVAPKLEGWEFIAVIDFDQHAGLVTRPYPGATKVDRSKLRPEWCDHCQTSRYRTTTMVVRNVETGEQIQVGSSCIKDFTGWTAMPYMLSSMSKDMEEMEGGFGGGGYDVTTLTVLGIAWACVKTWGYVKSREAGSTVQRVRDVINPPKPSKGNGNYLAELAMVRELSGEMDERATALRNWIASDEFSGNSEYVLNLKAIAAADRVSSSNYGLLCSAPQAWARFLEKSLIRKVETAKDTSEFVGEIGERWAIPVTVESERFIETAYGCSTLYKMRDEKGNLYSWFASNGNLEVGDKVTISAGIKGHKEYKGVNETQVTRVKVVDDVESAFMVKPAPIKAKDEIRLTDLTIDPKAIYFFNNTYFRIRVQKGIAYAVKFTENGWEYSNKSINVIKSSDILSAEDAARFGQEHGQCIYCSKPLSDERSMIVGYGAQCAATHGLPWGE